jgi:hypothetical protein
MLPNSTKCDFSKFACVLAIFELVSQHTPSSTFVFLHIHPTGEKSEFEHLQWWDQVGFGWTVPWKWRECLDWEV